MHSNTGGGEEEEEEGRRRRGGGGGEEEGGGRGRGGGGGEKKEEGEKEPWPIKGSFLSLQQGNIICKKACTQFRLTHFLQPCEYYDV